MATLIGALRVSLGLDGSQFGQGLSQAEGRAQSFQRTMVAMGAKLGGVLGAAFSVRAAAQAADAWSDMSSRVGVAVGNMQAAPAIMERIHGIAQMTYSPLQQTADGFAANNAALKGLGYSTDKALDYTQALNNALVVSGAKGDRAASVARALSVALATGKLSGDGLNTVLSDGGEIAEILAKKLGTSRNGLIKMASDGKITAKVIADTLIANMDDLSQKAADMPATIGDGFQLISNSLTNMVGRIDQATGTSGLLAEALGGIASGIDAATKFILANSDTIVTALSVVASSAAVVAGVLVTRYAVALAVTTVRATISAVQQSIALQMALGGVDRAAARAAVASITFSRALNVLKAALISTGIGALVVGAGTLVGVLMTLTARTGSFGEAWGLVVDVAAEAFGRFKSWFGAIGASTRATLNEITASALEVFADIVAGGAEFSNRYIGIYRGAFEAIKALWALLPSIIGAAAIGAANAMISAVEFMLKGVAGAIDSFANGISGSWIGEKLGLGTLDLAGKVNLDRIEDTYKDDLKGLGSKLSGAFMEGFNTDTFDPSGITSGLQGVAGGLRTTAGAWREASGMLAKDAERPMTAWQKMKDLLLGVSEEAAAIPPAIAPAGDALADAGGKGKGKLSDLQKVLKSLREEWDLLRATWNMSDLQAQIWEKQRDAGVKANSVQGQQIAGLVTQIDGMKRLKEATEDWSQSISSAFSSFITQGGSFKKVLSDIIGKLAEMVAQSAFKSLFAGFGGKGFVGSILGALGIGANANGTPHWTGGLTALHERGAEIVDLPQGARVYPHDLSKRMADQASDARGGTAAEIIVRSEPGVIVEVARGVVRQERPGIVGESVGQVRKNMQASKHFANGRI